MLENFTNRSLLAGLEKILRLNARISVLNCFYARDKGIFMCIYGH